MTRQNAAVEDLQLIREASKRIKELSAAATPGPWEVRDGNVEHFFPAIGEYGVIASPATPEAEHIATWDPDVALIVAGWIDKAGADLWAHGPLTCCEDGCDECDDLLWAPHVRQALKLARKIIGQEI